MQCLSQRNSSVVIHYLLGTRTFLLLFLLLCAFHLLSSAGAQTTERVSIASSPAGLNRFCYSPSFSADARYVAFTSRASNYVVGDTNNAADIFVYDRITNEKTRVSVSSTGEQGNADSGYRSVFST